MIKRGQAPFLECSSKGDKRFSAFYAKVDGRSIEDQYQKAKVLEDGRTGLTWREAKGKRAINNAEVRALYERLWERYIEENPDLLDVLLEATGLSDVFGEEGHACQATSLWNIRKKALSITLQTFVEYEVAVDVARRKHERALGLLKRRLKNLQDACPHKKWVHHSDSAGDSSENCCRCLLCGKEI